MNQTYLNIGSGRAKVPGFINIDSGSDADVQHDVRRGLPFENNSVHGILCGHFIQRLTQREMSSLLRECRRVLVHDGILRISTPDLDVIVEEYQSGRWRQPWMEKYGYGWIANRAETLNIVMREWDHKWLFNEEELVRLGEFAGFNQWRRCEMNISQEPMLADRDLRPESTLIIELKKTMQDISGNPLVSIVIPAYKPTYFEEALQSALGQSYQNIEILVLDDSADGRIGSVLESRAGNRKIRYARNEPRLGEAASLSLGIARAKGELIKPLYDDDVLEPDCVSRLVSALQEAPEATLATTRRMVIDGQGRDLGEAVFTKPLVAQDCEIDGVCLAQEVLSSLMNRIGEPSTVMFRRQAALNIQPVVLSFCSIPIIGLGDVALYLNLLSKGNAVYLTEIQSRFRMHAEQVQRDPNVEQQIVPSWNFLRRHAYRLGMFNPTSTSPLRYRLLGQARWSDKRVVVGGHAE